MSDFVTDDEVSIVQHQNPAYVGRKGQISNVGTALGRVTQPVLNQLPRQPSVASYSVTLDDGTEVNNLRKEQLYGLNGISYLGNAPDIDGLVTILTGMRRIASDKKLARQVVVNLIKFASNKHGIALPLVEQSRLEAASTERLWEDYNVQRSLGKLNKSEIASIINNELKYIETQIIIQSLRTHR